MAPEGAREKNIIIKGPADAVEAAKRLISEKIGGDPYGTVRSLPVVRYRQQFYLRFVWLGLFYTFCTSVIFFFITSFLSCR
jgi:hypothetical protein